MTIRSVRNNLSKFVRHWLQLTSTTATVAVGGPGLENKRVVPEAWMVNHLPVYLGFEGARGRMSLCLTDMTEEELTQLQVLINAAFEAAYPICKKLDEAAFKIMNDPANSFEAIPNRALRGPAPQMARDINTDFSLEDLTDEDRAAIEPLMT